MWMNADYAEYSVPRPIIHPLRGALVVVKNRRSAKEPKRGRLIFSLPLDAAGKDCHFLSGLLVAFFLGHGDALAVSNERFFPLALFSERAAEQFPGRGIKRILLYRFTQMLKRLAGITRLQILVA